MTLKKWVPDRKIMAGGLASVVAFFAVVGLAALGVVIPMEVALPLVAGIGPAVSYFVPSSVKEIMSKADEVLRDIGNKAE